MTYKRGDIIMHPMVGKAWLHIAEVKYDDKNGYVYECINQKTGKKILLAAEGYDTITLISETRRR